MSRPASETLSPARILVIRLSALGDVIRTLPLLPPLKHRFPTASLHWLCEAASLPILQHQPLLDSVLAFPRARFEHSLRRARPLALARHLARLVRDLRRARFDLVLDAQGTYKSGLLALLTGAAVRVGFARGGAKEFLPGAATRSVRTPSQPISRVEKALLLLGPLAADPGRAAAALPEDRETAIEATRLWAAAGSPPRVLLSPGASPRQAYKRWPAARFGELARRLRKMGVTVRVSWGPGEQDLASAVTGAAGGGPVLLPPTSLALLAELARQADLLVGNDSGPTHLASLVGTRVVVLYGPTDPVVNAPWGDGHLALDGAGPDVPRRRDPALMERIDVDVVLRAVTEALDLGGPGSG